MSNRFQNSPYKSDAFWIVYKKRFLDLRCGNGKCIPERFKCDKQQDCENNEDEADCDPSVIRTCSQDEYTCNNGACILVSGNCLISHPYRQDIPVARHSVLAVF